ncbi:MAG TPA: hypothetical protein VHQ21_15180 [Rhodanobacteraceae bacterium]|nr:hypothetical protein [Rhodanobacteraceae bacterium]
MDAAEIHRDLTDPAWRRWLLLGALAGLGLLYLLAFDLFVTRSRDFVVALDNQRALDYARAHILPVPSTLSFGESQTDNARLGGGWHRPDAGGIWSQAKDTFVAIIVAHPHPPLHIRLNTTAFVAAKRPKMRVTATINDVPAGKWVRTTSNANEPLDLQVPASLASADQLLIRLHTDHIASPFRLDSGPDSRQLGILLYSAEVRDADP